MRSPGRHWATTIVTLGMAMPSIAAAADGSAQYTMADVAQHRTAQSCWSAIDLGAGPSVYDLTSWIGEHAGVSSISGLIEPMCGNDGSRAFLDQHVATTTALEKLSSLRIGALVATPPSPSPAPSVATSGSAPSSTAAPRPSTTPKPTAKRTITCVKGKFTRRVTAVKPRCPAGFRLKR